MTTIITVAEYYGRQLSENVLRMYAQDLADLDPNEVVKAYERFRKNPANRTFPLPSQIRELVNPHEFVAIESQARETAARIVGAIKMFGHSNAKSAEKYIGAVGWDAIRRRGGWADLCQNLGENLSETTFQAQMRDLIESNLRYSVDAIEESIGAKSLSKARGDLIPIGRGIEQLLGLNEPKEPA